MLRVQFFVLLSLQLMILKSFPYFFLSIFYNIQTKEKKPRESLLRAEFAKSIHVINKDLPEEERLRFLHWDLSKHARR